VDKGSAASRAEAGREMAAKLCDKNAPRFLVFAEGQTSDGRQVLAFKDGAFRLGHAVQPVPSAWKANARLAGPRGCPRR
jgi:lysophosphatidylcholine acyltransferase/lyso-PAF acetyltransferase